MDKIIKTLAYEGRINMVCINTTNLVEKARKVHDLSPLATAALGRILTMTAIMASNLKGKENTISLQIKGKGPIGSVVAVGDNTLKIRGYVNNPTVDLPLKENGKLDVGEAIGKEGNIYVVKDVGLKDPYVGISKIITGEIAEDFANYFCTSEQKNTAVALGVLVDKNGVKASGGYIITAMPDAREEDLFILEQRIQEAKTISQMLEENWSLIDIAKDITGDENIQILEQELEPTYECNCSKEKMQKALCSVGKKELETIIKEDKKAELVCQFCTEKYEFTEQELKQMIETL